MPLPIAELDLMANSWAARVTHVGIATADPGATGANQSAAPRVAVALPAASGGGDITLSNVAITGGEPNGPIHSVSFWGAATGTTTHRGSFTATGDLAFNAEGKVNLASFTLDGVTT
ncbi:MAG: hypothetical protein M3Q39_09765 [Actinomycetota bacterium]|nr:hypothetical protein [Actinomycetota bacterium]